MWGSPQEYKALSTFKMQFMEFTKLANLRWKNVTILVNAEEII